jgi:hypothetical protein
MQISLKSLHLVNKLNKKEMVKRRAVEVIECPSDDARTNVRAAQP